MRDRFAYQRTKGARDKYILRVVRCVFVGGVVLFQSHILGPAGDKRRTCAVRCVRVPCLSIIMLDGDKNTGGAIEI